MAAYQGFHGTVLYSDAFGTKVSGRHREGGHLSGVAVKRGSIVASSTDFISNISVCRGRRVLSVLKAWVTLRLCARRVCSVN